jgi:hypothetical protein
MKQEKSKKFKLEISEKGLQTIMSALECYSRLGINQFGYCLEHNPAFNKLDYETRDEIEKYLKFKIDSRNFGIYHPEVVKFHDAWQIKKEIQKQVAISKEPIMEHYTNTYDGATDGHDFVPIFLDENGNKIEHKTEIEIPKNIRGKLKKLSSQSKWPEIWDLIDKNVDRKGIRGNMTRIAEDFTKITIHKPYRINLTTSV